MSTELDRIRNMLPRRSDDDMARHPAPALPIDSFFHFRYSYTEISARDDSAYVRHRETSFRNGKLVTEECEGALDIEAYERMVEESQRAMLGQMAQAMRLFLLPFALWRRDG